MAGQPTGTLHNDESSSDQDKPLENHTSSTPSARRKDRLPRACTSRSSHNLNPDFVEPTAPAVYSRKGDQQQQSQSSKVVTALVSQPLPEDPRWALRSMWEMASVLNFFHIFRPLLNIKVEFSVEELETALLTPNATLDDIHIPLLKAIPPITRMALGRSTWVTVLCRKLKDWWHWVADGNVPIVASHGTEVETYKNLDPGTRVVILKVLCDIRVEQEDIRSYIDDSMKHGAQLSAFRKERIGGDSHGISYWYEDDPVIGHRLYREIKKFEPQKTKGKGHNTLSPISSRWETVATTLEEFQEVSERLMSSKNRTETAFGKKLLLDIVPEVEKEHKRRERLLKKQQRQALLLDSFFSTGRLASGRSLRDRKPVTYTFDDYDRCISEAIKITKRRPSSPEPVRSESSQQEALANGSEPNDTKENIQQEDDNLESPMSTDSEEVDTVALERNNRRRQRPQRYSTKEFVEAVSGNEADFDSDDEIVGEAVYDEGYLSKKQRKASSSSEEDEEYQWDHENVEDEDEDNLSSASDDELAHVDRRASSRNVRGVKTRLVDDLQSGLRRSARATRTRIDYRQYELSESESGSAKPNELNSPGRDTDATGTNDECAESSQDSDTGNIRANVESVMAVQMKSCVEMDQPLHDSELDDCKMQKKDVLDLKHDTDGVLDEGKIEGRYFEQKHHPDGELDEGKLCKREFLDLNELAPGAGFEDASTTVMKIEDTD